MAAASAPGARARAARLRGARSPRQGRGRAGVAGPHSPGSGSGRGRSAAARDAQPGARCADRAGNSAAAAAAATADSSVRAATAERSRAGRVAATFIGQARLPPRPPAPAPAPTQTPPLMAPPMHARRGRDWKAALAAGRVCAPAPCGARGSGSGTREGSWRAWAGLPEAPGGPQDLDTEPKPGPDLWQQPQSVGRGLEYTDSFGRHPCSRTCHGSLLHLCSRICHGSLFGLPDPGPSCRAGAPKQAYRPSCLPRLLPKSSRDCWLGKGTTLGGGDRPVKDRPSVLQRSASPA